jgi:hypothetical protein
MAHHRTSTCHNVECFAPGVQDKLDSLPLWGKQECRCGSRAHLAHVVLGCVVREYAVLHSDVTRLPSRIVIRPLEQLTLHRCREHDARHACTGAAVPTSVVPFTRGCCNVRSAWSFPNVTIGFGLREIHHLASSRTTRRRVSRVPRALSNRWPPHEAPVDAVRRPFFFVGILAYVHFGLIPDAISDALTSGSTDTHSQRLQPCRADTAPELHAQ